MPLGRMSDDNTRRKAIASDLLREGCMRKLVALALVALPFALCSVPSALDAASTGYHILNEIKVGGDGGWDYLTVDAAARRLYVSHATHVIVIDIDRSEERRVGKECRS